MWREPRIGHGLGPGGSGRTLSSKMTFFVVFLDLRWSSRIRTSARKVTAIRKHVVAVKGIIFDLVSLRRCTHWRSSPMFSCYVSCEEPWYPDLGYLDREKGLFKRKFSEPFRLFKAWKLCGTCDVIAVPNETLSKIVYYWKCRNIVRLRRILNINRKMCKNPITSPDEIERIE